MHLRKRQMIVDFVVSERLINNSSVQRHNNRICCNFEHISPTTAWLRIENITITDASLNGFD